MHSRDRSFVAMACLFIANLFFLTACTVSAEPADPPLVAAVAASSDTNPDEPKIMIRIEVQGKEVEGGEAQDIVNMVMERLGGVEAVLHKAIPKVKIAASTDVQQIELQPQQNQQKIVIMKRVDGSESNIAESEAQVRRFEWTANEDSVDTPRTPSQKGQVGLVLRPVDDALRAQLRLDGRLGILVDSVADNSPAARAGVRRFDVITHAKGKQLDDVQRLVAFLHDPEQAGKPIDLRVVRGGAKQGIVLMVPSASLPAQTAAAQRVVRLRQERDSESESLKQIKKQIQELKAAVEEIREAMARRD